MDIAYGRGYMYSIQYHIVWSIRHKVMTDSIKVSLKEILLKIANDNNFSIKEFYADSNYVHVVVCCTPQHSIPNMIKSLKGVSARLLMKKHGADLKTDSWDGHLWNLSYLVVTPSSDTNEQIQVYLQKEK